MAQQIAYRGTGGYKVGASGAAKAGQQSEVTEYVESKEYLSQVELTSGDGSIKDIILAGRITRKTTTGYATSAPFVAGSGTTGTFITRISGRSSNEDLAKTTYEEISLT